MFKFDETYSVDARDGQRIFARHIPELDVVGFYKGDAFLFSLKAADAYHWASNLSILTVSAVATDADKDSALAHLAAPVAEPA